MSLPQWNPQQTPPTDTRLFLGLWPSTETVQLLQPEAEKILQRAGVQGRALAPQHWHITLAFLGSTTATQWQQLVQQAQTWKLSLPPTVFLDRLGQFKEAEVLWLGADPNSNAYMLLQQAQQQLWQLLEGLGWQAEDRTFVPHVSLLRQVQLFSHQLSDIEINPVVWHNASLKLIVSLPNTDRSDYYQVQNLPLI